MAKIPSRRTFSHIVHATLRILEQQGPEAVSMRRIAKEVGVTPMAIYHHFPNREALLRLVTNQEFEQLRDFIKARQRPGSPEQRLINIMQGYVDYAFARPQIFDYVFSKERAGARQYPQDFRARRSPTLNPVADLASELMAEGYLKPDDVWEVALTLWAHVHGFVMLYRAGRFSLSENQFRTLVRRSLRRLIHGLCTN